jgi:hypothetical protein
MLLLGGLLHVCALETYRSMMVQCTCAAIAVCTCINMYASYLKMIFMHYLTPLQIVQSYSHCSALSAIG